MERTYDPLEGGQPVHPQFPPPLPDSAPPQDWRGSTSSLGLLGFTSAFFLSLPPQKDIKYIEVTSTRSRCLDGPQHCSSPCVSPPFGSPRSGGSLLTRDIPRETRSSNESLIFSGNQGRGPSPHIPSSLNNSIPYQDSKASGSPLATPPAWERGPRAPQRGSRVSMLSVSPVSDVSYVFGR